MPFRGTIFAYPKQPMPSVIRARRHQAGFTLIEMMGVVAFIGIVVAAAAPSWIDLTKDRRVENAALNIADLYRTARSRSMGRGSAVMVRWDANASMPTDSVPSGHFTVREGVAGPTGAANNLPTASCFTPDWGDSGTTSKHVMAFDERRTRFEPAEAAFLDDNATVQQYAQICFTPSGRTFIRYASSGNFSVMNGVPRVRVTNKNTKFARFVVFPPHGSARVVSQL